MVDQKCFPLQAPLSLSPMVFIPLHAYAHVTRSQDRMHGMVVLLTALNSNTGPSQHGQELRKHHIWESRAYPLCVPLLSFFGHADNSVTPWFGSIMQLNARRPEGCHTKDLQS